MGKKVILLIEDDIVILSLYRLHLETLLGDAFDIIAVQSAAEAEKWYERFKNDVICISVDADLSGGGSSRSAIPLISKWRKEGFAGRVIAATTQLEILDMMKMAGCDLAIRDNKLEVPKIIFESVVVPV